MKATMTYGRCGDAGRRASGQHGLPALRTLPLMVALALAAWGGPVPAQVLPDGFNRVDGLVTQAVNGNTMTLEQSTPRAIVDWSTFNIGQTQTVNIRQPGADSVILNRVNGPAASRIDGALNANGMVFIVNPAGITFGPSARVDVGGLVASTFAIRNDDFMAGNYVFDGQGVQNQTVDNDGRITAHGGTVALISKVVENSGTITADRGTIGLVGAQRVKLDMHGDGLTTFRVEADALAADASVLNAGDLQADGGRIVLLGRNTDPAALVVNASGTLRARTLAERGGEILLDAGDGMMGMVAGIDLQADLADGVGGALTATARELILSGTGINATGTRKGGNVQVTANQLMVDAPRGADLRIDVSGGQEGGDVRLHAQGGVLGVGQDVTVAADATGTSGKGGNIVVLGDATLYAYGQLSARGGAQGGDGGFIETSGAALDLNGLRVWAGAPAGRAGTWLIDPYNVDIQHGSASGSLPTGWPLAPLANTVLQDGDINAALNGGASVTITTGALADGNYGDGDIRLFNGVHILYDQAMGPQTLTLQAHRSVRSDVNVLIESAGAGGPLDVVFQADVYSQGIASGGGQVSFSGDIYTNGGNVRMEGNWANAGNAGCGVCLDGDVIDTRVGRSDAGAGGAITLRGVSVAESPGRAGVYLEDTELHASTGDVRIDGNASQGSGVWLAGKAGVFTTSGVIDVQGLGGASSSAADPGHGVRMTGTAALVADSGALAVRGRSGAGGAVQGSGVSMDVNTRMAAGGLMDVAGHADGGAAGLALAAGSVLQGGAGVVLRAGNDGAQDAIVLDGAVQAAQWLNLRPGTVDATGAALDSVSAAILLGDGAANGFAVSGSELAMLDTPLLLVGSNLHAGDITVQGPVQRTGQLGLQNTAGGDIDIQGPLSATGVLTLDAGAEIRQAAAGAPVTAPMLVLRAAGDVNLTDGAANAVDMLAARAGGTLDYANSGALSIVNGTGTGMRADLAAPETLAVNGAQGAQVQVRTLSDDLTLQAPVQSGGQLDLVAGRNFLNLAGGSVSAGSHWRIWSETWVGEVRGSLSGSGVYPNLYGYSGGSATALPNTGNTFVYVRQPEAVVTIADAQRDFGAADPAWAYSLAGLILGDSGVGISGVMGSPAQPHSPPGAYPIDGVFQSAEGYLVRVVPGTLTVADVMARPAPPDPWRETPQTYLYDRNIAMAPMCFATGPVSDPQAGEKDGDILAREWARVRSRPHLSNCVATDQRDGCADF